MSNALSREKSPYLLQHAHNPVDWMPWGEQAFEKARDADRPIFLSIGYSTCHWCHVMERESFENPSIAAFLNEHFVSIKVDREERPDVDATYMAFVVATTGHGGWPMSVWLTPDRKPFYGGTYYPPEDRGGRPGFPAVLERLASAWREDRDRIMAGAGRAVELLSQPRSTAPPDRLPGDEVFSIAFDQLARAYDPHFGGFGGAPKFPRAGLFTLLARLHGRLGPASQRGQRCRHMLSFTLTAMAQGGIHDHIGGGFHRYAVDTWWHVPHFEKMLYDQAQLAVVYLEAWQLTRDPVFLETAEGILDYVLRDMHDAGGAFHSAEDADSLQREGDAEKVEGGFYTWTIEEVRSALPAEEAELFCRQFWVKPDGNARPESDPLGELAGRNTLFVAESLEEAATHLGMPVDEVRALRKRTCERLRETRQSRPRPHRDDKIIVAWNGLMISALAKASAVAGRRDCAEAARAALRFIRDELFDESSSTLGRCWREGPAAVAGFADDYAMLIQACLDFYEAVGEIEWLQWAAALQESMDARFFDESRSGYQLAARDSPDALLPLIEWHDGAEPSANSVATLNLLRLASLRGVDSYRERAHQMLREAGGMIAERPFAAPGMVVALDFALASPVQVIVTRGTGEEEMRSAVHAPFLPHRVVLTADGGTGQEWLAQSAPAVAAMAPVDGRATAYVCRDFTCRPPVADPAQLDLA